MDLLSFFKLELSIFKILLYIFIPFGPLYARIVDLNGSLDHAWTMFPVFNVFPLSIIPVLMIAFGAIKNGNGSKPYDILDKSGISHLWASKKLFHQNPEHRYNFTQNIINNIVNNYPDLYVKLESYLNKFQL